MNYESIAYFLADEAIVVPAPWSGKRSYIDGTPISPIWPVQRTPEMPEGIEKVELQDMSKWMRGKRKVGLGSDRSTKP